MLLLYYFVYLKPSVFHNETLLFLMEDNAACIFMGHGPSELKSAKQIGTYIFRVCEMAREGIIVMIHAMGKVPRAHEGRGERIRHEAPRCSL